MKTFHHILRTTSAVILALLAGAVVACLGIIVYSAYRNVIGVLAIGFFLTMGLYIGYMVYTQVHNRGLIGLGAFSKSSQELELDFEDDDEDDGDDDDDDDDDEDYKGGDDEDKKGDEVRKFDAAELSKSFRLKSYFFTEGLLKLKTALCIRIKLVWHLHLY